MTEQVHTAEVHTVDPEVSPTKTAPAKVEIQSGLTIGLATDGGFIFRVLGKEASLPELQGIVKYAEIVLDNMVRKQLGLNDRGPVGP
jgi:hypothetical protein